MDEATIDREAMEKLAKALARIIQRPSRSRRLRKVEASETSRMHARYSCD